MKGKFFDDWTINEEFINPDRTITETDVVMFAAMTGDYPQLQGEPSLVSNETVEKPLFMMITVPANRTVKKAVIFAECRC